MNMVCWPRDEAPGSGSVGEYQPWSWEVADAQPMRASFENLALLTGGSPPVAGDLIGVLLASASLTNDRGCEVLRPLWTAEAMHRAHTFMRLIDANKRLGQSTRENPIAAGVEDFAAHDLAARLSELRNGNERAVVPCAAVLRDIVTDLATLFGYKARLALKTKIDRVVLPAYKRRALVLATSELFCNALLHAFPGPGSGLIEVSLTLRDPGSACLRVADNGIGFNDVPPNFTRGVAAGLAELLEADLAYDRVNGWTIAEIVLPVGGS